MAAGEPDRDDRHAGSAGAVRGHSRGRRTGEPHGRRPGARADRTEGRARGDPVRWHLQLSAAADALGGWAGSAPGHARDRGAARPARGRREPLRPRRHRTAVDDSRAGESRGPAALAQHEADARDAAGAFAAGLAEAGGFARVAAGCAGARHTVPLRGGAVSRRRTRPAIPRKLTACGSRPAC